jgi:hypothetical protein
LTVHPHNCPTTMTDKRMDFFTSIPRLYQLLSFPSTFPEASPSTTAAEGAERNQSEIMSARSNNNSNKNPPSSTTTASRGSTNSSNTIAATIGNSSSNNRSPRDIEEAISINISPTSSGAGGRNLIENLDFHRRYNSTINDSNNNNDNLSVESSSALLVNRGSAGEESLSINSRRGNAGAGGLPLAITKAVVPEPKLLHP